MESLDLQLIHALQVDGRAPFSKIAQVLGVSDQTIARRYRRLRENAALRIVGRLDARLLGYTDWVIRVQCAPGSSPEIAQALAERVDTSWVRLISGGTEVCCTVQAAGDGERDRLLLGKLPATRPVTAISAHCLLHTYLGGPTSWQGVTSALTEDQVRALAPESGPGSAPASVPVPASMSGPDVRAADRDPIELHDADRPLLAELARDGRAAHAVLASATGWSEATVRRRVAHLRESGALFFDLDVDDRQLGSTGAALLWIRVAPDRLAHVGRALAAHREIAFVAATTGVTNLLASVLCQDVYALYDYLERRVGQLPGIREIETTPTLRTVKRTGVVHQPSARQLHRTPPRARQ